MSFRIDGSSSKFSCVVDEAASANMKIAIAAAVYTGTKWFTIKAAIGVVKTDVLECAIIEDSSVCMGS